MPEYRNRPIPLIAIVGPPNVGKSRLFNRLTRSRQAIVEDTPGVTRDRNYGEGEWFGRLYNVVDTGGFDPDSTDPLLSMMRDQAQLAIDEADIVLVLFDGKVGVTPGDSEIVEIMRSSKKQIFYVVNKIDAPSHEPRLLEFYELGLDMLYPTSAEHGLGCDDLMEVLTEGFPTEEELEADRDLDDDTVKIAVLGRPNVGKSTLINQLLGEDRLLTSDIPGTTRDAIDSAIEIEGQRYLFIDTAGVRRKPKVRLALERFSVVRALSAIDRADVVLFLLDPDEGPTDQDARLLGLANDKGRGVVLLVNKWDTIQKDTGTSGAYVKGIRETWPFMTHAPIEFISAKTGQRVHRILTAALEVRRQWRKRISTSELNQFLADAVAKRQPPISKNRRPKLFYVTQAAVAPPTFVVFCKDPSAIPGHYRRFLSNQLRVHYGFEGCPIRLYFRRRGKKERE